MSWWGKLVGGAFGFMIGGPLGAVLGAALGHNFDRGLEKVRLQFDPGAQERVQAAFFTATFSVMGRLAKVDGRVSEDEIAFAREVMAQMALDEEQRRVAIRLFNEGKADDFPLDEALEQFRRECARSYNLKQMFLEILLQAGYADGRLDTAERDLLIHIFERLGLSRHHFEQLDAMVRAARHFGSAGAAGGGAGYQTPPSRDHLKDAYAVLGVSKEVSDAEVKKAYRRLMNQHHPDKLVAKGLPEEMIKLATEKTQEIKKAYETVKQSRGMR